MPVGYRDDEDGSSPVPGANSNIVASPNGNRPTPGNRLPNTEGAHLMNNQPNSFHYRILAL